MNAVFTWLLRCTLYLPIRAGRKLFRLMGNGRPILVAAYLCGLLKQSGFPSAVGRGSPHISHQSTHGGADISFETTTSIPPTMSPSPSEKLQYQEKRKAIDLSHHLSDLSRARATSPLKGLARYFGRSDLISLAGGMFFGFCGLVRKREA